MSCCVLSASFFFLGTFVQHIWRLPSLVETRFPESEAYLPTVLMETGRFLPNPALPALPPVRPRPTAVHLLPRGRELSVPLTADAWELGREEGPFPQSVMGGRKGDNSFP